MTPPAIASQRVKLCPRDGLELRLDLETARTAVDAGWPAVALYRCLNGHSHRDWPETAARTERAQGARPCAWCGGPLPVLRSKGLGSRKYHPGTCTASASRERSFWCWHHPGKDYHMELAPWYKGPLSAHTPLPPLDPLAGSLGREWLEGWARVHGYEAAL